MSNSEQNAAGRVTGTRPLVGEPASGMPSPAAPSDRPEPFGFRAVGYVDHRGGVHWEPGRQPTNECLLYVATDNRSERKER